MSVGARLYRLLLKLYPRSHRRRFEAEMERCFAQLAAEPEHQGVSGRLRLWLATLVDVSRNVSALWWSRAALRRGTRRRGMANAMGDFVGDLWLGGRSLARRPSFSIVAVVTLAIGVSANLLVFTVVHATLLRPLPYPDPTEVYSVWPEHWFTRGELAHIDARVRSFDVAGALTDTLAYLGGDEPLQLDALHVSSGYFDLFGVAPLLGRALGGDTVDDDAVVLSEGAWQRLYGAEPDVVGRTMVLNDRPYVIAGVMPRSFAPLPLAGELWIRMEMDPAKRRYDRTNEIQLVARLDAGITLERANDELITALGERAAAHGSLYDADFGQDASLVPLQEAVTGDFRGPLIVLQAAVVIILLMAFTNVANVALAGASTRTGEMAIRSALGAARWQLARQWLAEGLAIGALGAAVGFVGARLCLPLLVSALPFDKPDWLRIDLGGPALGCAAALIVAGAASFGFFPAIVAARTNLLARAGRFSSVRTERFRSGLVMAQIALAMVLLFGAGLTMKSFSNLMRTELGFDTDETVAMRLNPSPGRYSEPEHIRLLYREIRERVKELPGVRRAGMARQLPLRGAWFGALRIEGEPRDGDRGRPVQWTPTDPGYFATLGLRLAAGRFIEDTDRASSLPVALVNETFAERYLAGNAVLGRRVAFVDSPDDWITIVGVVEDVKQNGPVGFDFPMVYRPFEQSPVRSMRVVVNAPAASLPSIRRAVWNVDPDIPISETTTMDDVLSAALAEPRLQVAGLSLFGAAALVLGMVGIYGVVSYVTSRRTYDIGVLLALGAERRHVLRDVLSRGMKPVIAGMIVGLVSALWLSRWLASLLHEVSPTDPAIAAAVAGVLAACALVACYLPARRASRTDPTIALRFE